MFVEMRSVIVACAVGAAAAKGSNWPPAAAAAAANTLKQMSTAQKLSMVHGAWQLRRPARRLHAGR